MVADTAGQDAGLPQLRAWVATLTSPDEVGQLCCGRWYGFGLVITLRRGRVPRA